MEKLVLLQVFPASDDGGSIIVVQCLANLYEGSIESIDLEFGHATPLFRMNVCDLLFEPIKNGGSVLLLWRRGI
jgi:hypothetical protein